MHIFELSGGATLNIMISCIIFELLILGGYALAMGWIGSFVRENRLLAIIGRLLGALSAVWVGDYSARIFIEYFPNLKDKAESPLLVIFIGFCMALCFSLVRFIPKNHPLPPVSP